MFGPELRKQAVEVLGKYSLLGETAAVRHRPMYLQIAMCEHEILDVRICAMQVRGALGVLARGCPAVACRASVCAGLLHLVLFRIGLTVVLWCRPHWGSPVSEVTHVYPSSRTVCTTVGYNTYHMHPENTGFVVIFCFYKRSGLFLPYMLDRPQFSRYAMIVYDRASITTLSVALGFLCAAGLSLELLSAATLPLGHTTTPCV